VGFGDRAGPAVEAIRLAWADVAAGPLTVKHENLIYHIPP
jgi:hypothetical protein